MGKHEIHYRMLFIVKKKPMLLCKLRKGLDTVESLSGVARGSISKIFLVLLEGPKIGLLQPNLNKIFRVL